MTPEHLTLAPDEVRRLGYRVVDAWVDHMAGLRELAPATRASFEEVRARVDESPPERPGDPDAILGLVLELVREQINHPDHPRNFARVPSPSNPLGVLGDMLATGMNAGAMSASGHPGPTALEVVVLRWLAELLGLPPDTDGVMLSGGSVSSLTAFATARHVVLGGHDPAAVAYLSDQAHASMARGLRLLGLADDRIRVLASDGDFRMPIDGVAGAVAADRAGGLRPFCVIATAGSTNTGAVDPLGAIAQLTAEQGKWLHVDGAFGAPAALTPGGRALLAGIERSDSVTLDPHKWLFNPYEAGVLLVTRPGALDATFAVAPEYLRDASGAVNFRDRGPQLTRGTRALKLWMTLKTFGIGAVREAIERGIELAELAEATLRATPGWE
ncbi:MAG: pyridoxal phosphate-dependent decarboxylase family protein, partial [Solirubrobacteraceae bacterium]